MDAGVRQLGSHRLTDELVVAISLIREYEICGQVSAHTFGPVICLCP